MLKGLKSWIVSEIGTKNRDELFEEFPNIPNNNDVYLSEDELRKIHERIRNCIDGDQYVPIDDTVDNTLRLMREETDKWYKSPDERVKLTSGRFEKYDNREDVHHGNVDINKFGNDDAESEEIMAYCLRLEQNNEYLLQLVEKFEQLSFKKRYSELLMANENLQKEYNRLKSTNGKVYGSYCDLLEDIKKRQLENKKLKESIEDFSKKESIRNSKIQELQLELDALKRENKRSANKIEELRKSNQIAQKAVSEKETELIKLKGTMTLTQLKLERAEKMLFNPKSFDEVKMKTPELLPVSNDENMSFEISTPQKDTDDTIAQLQKKFATKSKLIT